MYGPCIPNLSMNPSDDIHATSRSSALTTRLRGIMSSLAYTAQFVSMGRAPFGSKPKGVAVFAQHLSGGSETTIFSSLDTASPVLRLRQRKVFSASHLMAGFVLAEPRLPLEGKALTCAEQLREVAGSVDLQIDDSDAAILAMAVSTLEVTLILTDCQGTIADVGLDPAFGDWVVTKSMVELGT